MLLTEFTTLLKNLWEKLMNNIKKYIKNIWAIMPMHTKKEKFYLNELKKHLLDYFIILIYLPDSARFLTV